MAITSGWNPIGTTNNKYTGTFDGDGYTITFKSFSPTRTDFGFFGHLGANAVVKNLKVKGENFIVRSSAALICGQAEAHSRIVDCSALGSIQSGFTTNVLAGSGATPTTTNGAAVAGICVLNYGTISNCTNYATVTCHKAKLTDAYAAGICSENRGTVSGCTNSGDVSMTTDNNCSGMGGIVGLSDHDSVSKCVNRGAITLTLSKNNSSGSYVGGLIGSIYNSVSQPSVCEYSANYGRVRAKGDNNANKNFYMNSYAGGLAGRCKQGTFKSCINSAIIEGYSDGTGDNYSPFVATADKIDSDLLVNNVSVFNSSLNYGKAYGSLEFSSGEVAYYLNSGEVENPVWRQTLGTNPQPVLDSASKIVYYGYEHGKSDLKYSNNKLHPTANSVSSHNDASNVIPAKQGYTCSVCGVRMYALYKHGETTPCGYSILTNEKYHYEPFSNGNHDAKYGSGNACAVCGIEASFIYNEEQLKSYFSKMQADQSLKTYARLLADITLTGTWPGYFSGSGKAYNGVFDGAGHTISGLKVEAESDYAGFIGYNSGELRNLTVRGEVNSSKEYVGLVAGYNGSKGIIKNCVAEGNVKGTNSVGGICGYSLGRVSGCVNYASVTGAGSVGGVIGYASMSELSQCQNIGHVSGKGNVGGLIGYTRSITLTDCGNAGDIVSYSENTDTYNGRAAGLVGACYNENSGVYLSNVYNYGSVKGNHGSHQLVNEFYNFKEGDGFLEFITEKSASYIKSGSIAVINGSLTAPAFRTTDNNLATKYTENQFKDGTVKNALNNGRSVWHQAASDPCPMLANAHYVAPEVREISTAIQLAEYLDAARDPLARLHGKLLADIELPDNWSVSFNANGPFYGVLDGNSHTISGLKVEAVSNYAGFIGYNSGELRNLMVRGEVNSSKDYVGLVAGYNGSEGIIENCVTEGNVKGTNSVGGICGYSSGRVSGCVNYASVTGTSSVGGVIGYASMSELSQCQNIGHVSGK
ncbi:MAG: hypothetical protein MJZ02_01315, partial [Paludibacteraceae bacterium]|nr:hypothetical protein [Paludibacteraceae bacterium]